MGTSRRSLFKVLVAATAEEQHERKNRPVGRHLAFGADSARQVVISWQQLEKVNGP